MLWVPRVGWYYAIVLVGAHMGIEVVTETGYWQFWMISALFVFMPPHWFRWMDRFAGPSTAPRKKVIVGSGT
jgi:cytosine/uracil/thiamine/allantoin permease